MRTYLIFLLLSSLTVVAQQKEFEGVAIFKTDVKSKNESISDRAVKNMLLLANTKTIYNKNGNYRSSYGIVNEYSIAKDEKVYVKLNGVDTLYYLNFNDVSEQLKNVKKTNEQATIAGLDCKSIVITTDQWSRKYFYAPALYNNPEPYKNYTLGRYDIFAKETQSFYLACTEESSSYILSSNCTSLKQTPVDDSMFKLPELPQRKFALENFVVAPEFSRPEGFQKYLEKNLNADIGAKVIRIPKGEKTAEESVLVQFMINENGKAINISVINKKEVHSKLAEEAVRVIDSSPLWKPAKLFGEKIVYWIKIPVVFAVTS